MAQDAGAHFNIKTILPGIWIPKMGIPIMIRHLYTEKGLFPGLGILQHIIYSRDMQIFQNDSGNVALPKVYMID